MKPSLKIENLETLTSLQEVYEDYNLAVESFAPLLKEKLELLDSDNGDGISLYSTLISNLKSLDGTYVQSKMRDVHKLRSIWTKLVASNEVQLDGKQIIVVRWKPKTESELVASTRKTSNPVSNDKHVDPQGRPRRISFASLKLYDADKILTIDELASMTDLQFLFSLNGYHLPGCDSTRDRGIYEHFFDIFLKYLLQEDKPIHDNLDKYVYQVLQETIFLIHIIVELFVNTVELLLEMINFVQLRIKTALSSTSLKINLRQNTQTVLDYIMTSFHDPDRAFVDFATQKLISKNRNQLSSSDSGQEKDITESQWTLQFLNYSMILTDAIELYESNCDQFSESIKILKDLGLVSFFDNRETSKPDRLDLTISYCNNIIVFIGEFKSLLKQLRDGPLYQRFLEEALKLMKALDDVEVQHPIKYGSMRRSGSPLTRSGSSTPRSNESSPRPILHEGKNPESPLMSSLGKLVSILSPRKK